MLAKAHQLVAPGQRQHGSARKGLHPVPGNVRWGNVGGPLVRGLALQAAVLVHHQHQPVGFLPRPGGVQRRRHGLHISAHQLLQGLQLHAVALVALEQKAPVLRRDHDHVTVHMFSFLPHSSAGQRLVRFLAA